MKRNFKLTKQNKSNGIKGIPKYSRTAKVQSIANALDVVPIVRNAVNYRTPLVKIELPLFVVVKQDGTPVFSFQSSGSSPLDQPVPGNMFEFCPEFLVLDYEADYAKIVALGAEWNFVNETDVTINFIRCKWQYRISDSEAYSTVDNTWFPIDYDKKVVQRYKTFWPNIDDLKNFTVYSQIVSQLRSFTFTTAMNVLTHPDNDVCIGSITLALWMRIKRRPVLDMLAGAMRERLALRLQGNEYKDKILLRNSGYTILSQDHGTQEMISQIHKNNAINIKIDESEDPDAEDHFLDM